MGSVTDPSKIPLLTNIVIWRNKNHSISEYSLHLLTYNATQKLSTQQNVFHVLNYNKPNT